LTAIPSREFPQSPSAIIDLDQPSARVKSFMHAVNVVDHRRGGPILKRVLDVIVAIKPFAPDGEKQGARNR